MAWGRPMASSTWEGSRDAEEQAEPEEAQMPLASRWSSRASPFKDKGGGAGQAVHRVAGEAGVGKPGQAVDEPVPQGGQAGGLPAQAVHRLPQGGGHTHRAGDVLGAGAAALLLAAALDERGQAQGLFHV